MQSVFLHSPQPQKQSSQACPSKTRRSPEIRPCRPAGPRGTPRDPAKRWRLGPRGPAGLQQVRAWRTASAAAGPSTTSAYPVLLRFSLSIPLSSSCEASRGGREGDRKYDTNATSSSPFFLSETERKMTNRNLGGPRLWLCEGMLHGVSLPVSQCPFAVCVCVICATATSDKTRRKRERERETAIERGLRWWLREAPMLSPHCFQISIDRRGELLLRKREVAPVCLCRWLV